MNQIVERVRAPGVRVDRCRERAALVLPTEQSLRCPACSAALAGGAEALRCDGCRRVFPVVRGVPILIDESRSMFRIADCLAAARSIEAPRPRRTRLREAVERLLPRSGDNFAGVENVAELARLLRADSRRARVLVLGGARLGVGCEALASEPAFELVECDVLFGPRTTLICDAHQLPFEDETFDAVVAQGVFEYLRDPFLVAAEIHRVLRPRGLVYAESPFLQHVHGGPYDLFRYTPAGHRLLFRRFEELRSGITAGPATVLAWSYRYFLRSFMDQAATRFAADVAARLSSFWVARLDRCLTRRPASLNAASGVYFLGRRSENTLTDRELVLTYRGQGVMGY